jgi:hypothetical protein
MALKITEQPPPSRTDWSGAAEAVFDYLLFPAEALPGREDT